MFFIIASFNAVASEPEYEVDISPETPVAGSEITFSITLDNYSKVDEVYLKYQECSDNLCYDNYNLSITGSDNGLYEKEVDLQKTEATYISYWVVINSNGSWFTSNEVKIDLEPYSDVDEEEKENGTPGFQMILLISALLISLFVIKRVRKK